MSLPALHHGRLLILCSGWYDPLIQHESYLYFAANAPGYGPLQNDSILYDLAGLYYGPGACRDQVSACAEAGYGPESDAICSKASTFCVCLYMCLAHRSAMLRHAGGTTEPDPDDGARRPRRVRPAAEGPRGIPAGVVCRLPRAAGDHEGDRR